MLNGTNESEDGEFLCYFVTLSLFNAHNFERFLEV